MPLTFTETPGGVEFQISLLKTKLMGDRLIFLDAANQGLTETGVELVGIGYVEKGALSPIPIGDDIGMYALIPHLAGWFDVSPAIMMMVFLLSGAILGAVAGIAISFALFKSWQARIFSVFAISFLTIAAIRIAGDFYLLMIPATLIVGFLALYVHRRVEFLSPWVVYAGLFFCGLTVASFHLLRAHSGTSALVLMAIFILLHKRLRFGRIFLMLTVVAVGVALPNLYGNYLIDKRDAYLEEHLPGYQPTLDRHVLWHSVYAGFSYIRSPYGFVNKDDFVIAEARRRLPENLANADGIELVTELYEEKLREAVIDVFLDHPFFVAKTVFSKAGAMVLYFLIFANIGVLFVLFHRRAWRIEAAFLPALFFSSLPGLLTQPNTNYITGYLCVVVIYAVSCVGLAFEDKEQKLFNRLSLLRRSDS